MADMKPRTGDGPLEVTKEGRGIVMRVPLEGGSRLVVSSPPQRPRTSARQLLAVVSASLASRAAAGAPVRRGPS
jgi:hypothetical protein